MTIFDIDPIIDERSVARLRQQLNESGVATIETVQRRKDGTTFPAEVAIRRVQLDRLYGVAVSRDITARKQAEQSLRQSEERFRRLVEHIHDALITDDDAGKITFANDQFLALFGFQREQLPRLKLEDYVAPEWREQLRDRHDRRLRGETVPARFEYEGLRQDGRRLWLEVDVVPLKDGTGRAIGTQSAIRDITERKQAEEALRQSEERFRVALKHSPITVFSQDRDLRYTWMYNPQIQGPEPSHLGKTPRELYGPEEGERMNEVRRRVLETGVAVRHEVQITDRGSKHYFDTTIEPVVDSTGAVIGLTGASADVTQLREITEALREAKKKLTEEKLYLEQEIDTAMGFGEIIGQSKALQSVMEQAGKVAASNATVLLLGETGTGKELVARALHRLCQRSNNSFIKLNCAAIPSGLLESELFGHEKGAFTGAVSKKIGRLELADKGTLFLDEIGEISLALQPKLLRVLQDQEFERLGGTHTLKVDFRLIAATNRDLAESVRENEFRSDLYYRLNVFPIRVPPLRERREDIRLLVEHFVQKRARRMGKSITSIPKKTMDALIGWEWPGNVRELENFIERSVILTQGSVLVSPLGELQPTTMTTTRAEKSVDETLAATERQHILRALRDSHGQVGGARGAAARLGLKRTTLQSKMKQFGINPRPGPTEH